MKNRPRDTSKIAHIVRADFRGATLLLPWLLLGLGRLYAFRPISVFLWLRRMPSLH